MNRSTIFMINAVIAVLFGLVFLLIPATVLSWYGVQLEAAGLFLARLYGSALLIFAIISWMVREAPASQSLRGIIVAFFIGDAIGFLLSLVYQLQGVANALGWSTVVIYLLLALAFGYLTMNQQRA